MFNQEQRQKAEVDLHQDINKSLAPRIHTYHFRVIDTYPIEENLFLHQNKRFPKLLLDPEPFRGKVVAYNDDYMLIKSWQNEFSAVALKFVTERPKVGTKVEVYPYQRRYFSGKSLSEYIRLWVDAGQTIVFNLYQERVPIPILNSEIRSKAMRNMIRIFDMVTYSKICFRTIPEILVDANTSEITFNNPAKSSFEEILPMIKFKVKTNKLDGLVVLSCDKSGEFFNFSAIQDASVIREEANLTGSELMSVLIECVDDGSWRKTIVQAVKR